MPYFTKDYTTPYAEMWRKVLGKFAGLPEIHGIEIGCLEGRSSLWFVANILEHETAHLTCIDPWPRPCFTENIRPVRHKIRHMTARSGIALRDPGLPLNSIDFIYVDGNPAATSVIENAVLGFALLKPGGILIFNDYRRRPKEPDSPQMMPKIAVDAFLHIFANALTTLNLGYQAIVEKR
jgi:predicted O-methyltransferase YrrM